MKNNITYNFNYTVKSTLMKTYRRQILIIQYFHTVSSVFFHRRN